MGLNLKGFVNQRLKALHNDVQNVVAPVQRAVVAPVVHAAGNTVNAGATTARDFGGAAQATGRFVAATPQHNVVLPTIAHAADFIPQFAINYSNAAANLGRKASNATGGRPVLPQTPKQQFTDPLTRMVVKKSGATGTGKQLTGDVAQIGLSLIPGAGKGASLLAKAGINAGVGTGFGAASAYGEGGNVRDIAKSAAISGLLGGALPVAGELASKGVRATTAIATAKPFHSINDAELAAADRVSMARSGLTDTTKPGDIQAYQRVQQKLGVAPDNHAAVDNFIGARNTYNARISQQPKLLGLGAEGGGKGTKYQSANVAPHEKFVGTYADALKQMDAGMTGGQLLPDGNGGYLRTSEHSPFYRQTYANTGRAPTKAAWLEESRRQLESGKADSYAQAEYNQLKSAATPQTQRLTENTPVATQKQLADRAKQYFANKPQATADYQAHTMDEFGTHTPNIASGDSAKFIVDGGKTLDPTHSVPYHEAASAFAKDYYKKLLANPETKDKPVLITGGGAGAGKTSSLTKLGSLDDYAAVNDTNLTNMHSAESRIEPALQSGRKVQVAYVYRDPIDAFTNGNIPRGQKIGRIVPIAQHTETHADSLSTIKQVVEKYKNNPNVEIKIIDNSHGPGAAKVVSDPVAFLKDKSYNKGKLEQDLLHELKNAQDAGTVSKEVAKAYREGLGPKSGRKSEPKHVPSVNNALKRSKSADRPTTISDALLAKNKKLQAVRDKKTITSSAKAETPVKPPVVLPEGKLKQNRFTKGAKSGRQNLSEPVTSEVQGKHAIRSTKQLQNIAAANAEIAGLDKTVADAHKALQAPAGKISDKDVALAQQAIEHADAAGRTEDAINLHDQLSAHLTKQGQSIQAASLFYKLSPQGQLYKAMRDIKKGGGTVTPELEADLRKQTAAIKDMKPGDTKDMAQAKFQKTVRQAIPQSKLTGALSVWKAGLLSGAKTQTGNLLSNATFAGLKKVSDLPAAGLDAVLSKFTGRRTKTFTMRGTAEGTKLGIRSGVGTLRTGIDPREVGNGGKYDVHAELNFKNPVIQSVFGKPSNLVFRGMNAADQPFYFAAVRNNLHDMALAEAKTRNLTGAEADAFVKNTVANPTRVMAEKAKLAAQKSVLGQDSKFAASLSHLAQEHPSVQIVAPFIKVPTNFLTRTLDFTPVGYVKAAVNAMKDARGGRGFDQRAFVEAIGEATTGSAVLYLGAEMANHGLLSGSYPTDPKEQQRWKAQGITPNSIHIGNKWVSMNYLGPLGLLLNAGKSYRDASAQGNTGWTQTLASFGQNLTGQSFLSGFSSFANALNDPQRYLTSLKNSEAGSLVPAWANDLANALDSKQRQASTVPQTIQSRLPLVRTGLPQKTDTYGNGLPQRTNAAQLTADPLRPSKDLGQNNAVIQEVSRLHNIDPNNKDLQVTPTPPTSINIEGKTVKLNAQQKYELTNKIGQAVQSKWGQLIKTPEYKALSNADKAKALGSLRGDVTTLTERQYVVDHNLGTYNKSPSTAVQALGQGQANLSDYTSKTQNSGAAGVILNKSLDSSSRSFLTKYNAMNAKQRTAAANSQNDYEYKLAQAHYANNIANGSLSTTQKVKAEAGLAKDQVGVDYNKNVRDLYTLSNGELSQYLATSEPGVDKNKLAEQVIAYGDALASAGVVSKNKFRTSKGALTLGNTSSSSGGSKFKTASIPSIKNNPYKVSSPKKTFKQVTLPKIKTAVAHNSYKTAALKTNISAKLRKA